MLSLLALLLPFPAESNISPNLKFSLQADVPALEATFFNYTQSGALIKPNPIETPKPALTYAETQNSGFSACSCVSAVKYWTGYTKSVGAARNWPVNGGTPQVGGVVISNYSWAGHVDLILGVDLGKRRMWVLGANWESCKVTERWMDMDDPNIIGYWVL